jgi:hypothetical protein
MGLHRYILYQNGASSNILDRAANVRRVMNVLGSKR